jgi:hypothetical protein
MQVPENGGDYINRLSMRQELSCIIGDKTAISANPARHYKANIAKYSCV